MTVVLVNEARQAKYEVKTNAGGRFEFVGLPPATTALEATGIGFQALKDMVTVSGQNLQRNYTLKLGTLQETIIVTDDRPRAAPSHQRAGDAASRAENALRRAPEGGSCRRRRYVTGTDLSGEPARHRHQRDGALEGRIALDGYLTDISVVGEAQPDMASSAIAAVREWQFTETLLNCQPVDVVMKITRHVQWHALDPRVRRRR